MKSKTSGRKVLDWKVVYYYVEESEYSSNREDRYKFKGKLQTAKRALIVNKMNTPFMGKAKDYQPKARYGQIGMDMFLTTVLNLINLDI